MFLDTLSHKCGPECPKTTFVEEELLHCIELTEEWVCGRVSFVFPSELSICENTSSMEFPMAPSEKLLHTDSLSLYVYVSGETKAIKVIPGRNSSFYEEIQELEFAYELTTSGKVLANVQITHSSGIKCSKIQPLTTTLTEQVLVDFDGLNEIEMNIGQSTRINLSLYHYVCGKEPTLFTDLDLKKAQTEWQLLSSDGVILDVSESDLSKSSNSLKFQAMQSLWETTRLVIRSTSLELRITPKSR